MTNFDSSLGCASFSTGHSGYPKKKTSSNIRLLDVFRRGEKLFFCFFIIGNSTIATLTEKQQFCLFL